MITPEVGKRYRTRDGREARISTIPAKSARVIFGWLPSENISLYSKRLRRWYANGNYFTEPHHLDLIECIGENDE